MFPSNLHLQYPLEGLKGADYNPRYISDESMQNLQDSIAELGCVKPIIVRNSTIVAGHQRTKAMRKMGLTHGPVYLLSKDTTETDEARFNQLHNGTDIESLPTQAFAEISKVVGFQMVKPDSIHATAKQPGAAFRHAIMDLVLKYGAWGACVADQSGSILHGVQYAIACKTLRIPCLTYVLPIGMENLGKKHLAKTYGVFSYDHLKRDTFIQNLAQLPRLTETLPNRSPTYEQLLIPSIPKTARILDFGCGRGDYVNLLAKQGYAIQGLEFFRKALNSNKTDIAAVNRMVDHLLDSLKQNGLFDVVVCDYVLNSVDSMQAESDVLNCIQAFCKPDGLVLFSGRTFEKRSMENAGVFVTSRQSRRRLEFLDQNGFSAIYREGHWFYQKFHTPEDVAALCKRQKWTVIKMVKHSNRWNVMAKNSSIQPKQALESIAREFNMEMDKTGRRLNRHQDVIEVMSSLLAS